MGTCFSKKTTSPSSSFVLPDPPQKDPSKPKTQVQVVDKEKDQNKILIQQSETTASEEECVKKKEIFVIKQRKSHERPRPAAESQRVSNVKTDDCVGDVDEPTLSDPCVVATNFPPLNAASAVNVVRTSSCTKEEVDAILIQCGRLSRSSSSNKGGGGSGTRKYSGSKRSFDFDHDTNNNDFLPDDKKGGEDDHHYSRPSHRRTHSRDKDGEHKRSSSRDRSSSSSKDQQDERSRSRGSGSRRASRSPGRRSETQSSAAATSDKSKPGKMVSVPASNRDNVIVNGGNAAVPVSNSATTVVKRVSVKRNGEAGSFRGTASPRSQSPACARPNNVNNENAQQHQPSLSRNSSRKAEQSPYRRNPMSEIDENCPRREQQQPPLKSQDQIKTHRRKESSDEIKVFPSQNHQKQQQQVLEEQCTDAKGFTFKTSETNAAPQAINRSRSSRRSRDLDFNTTLGFNPDTLLNPTSYASMLLEDIQNFHQQNNGTTNTTTPVFTLPPCVTKACSILEAVADLNSCNSGERSSELVADWSNSKGSKNGSSNSALPHLGKKRLVDVKDPFVESEVVVKNGLNEPSLHKYVTVRRGVVEGEIEVEQQQESSGSNSFVGGHNWATSSPCSWEPNSADSAATSRPNSNTYGETVVAVDKENSQAVSAVVGHDDKEAVVDARRTRSNGSNRSGTPSQSGSGKKRELQHQYNQNGRGRQGRAGGVSQAIHVAATISS